MKYGIIFSVASIILLTGCETMQTPQQRREAQARQQAAQRHAEEQVYRVRGQVESVEMENARMVQEVQQLRSDVRSLNSQMASLEAKQKREMDELIRRVETLLKKSVASRPAATSQHQGAGYEHEVRSGHTLSTIAAKYGTTVSAIMKANNLKSDQIYVGQKLFIPQ
jgi:LysM repeat protein